MEAPSGSSLAAPPAPPVGAAAVLPGLECPPMRAAVPDDASEPGTLDDAARMCALVTHIADPVTERTLDGAVSALEGIRRLESWLVWSKHRLAAAAVRTAETDQKHWLATTSIDAFDDESHPGSTRNERLAVGERSGIAEVACALQVSEGAAHVLLKRSENFARHLAPTARAMREGGISATAGMLIADEISEYADMLPSAVDEATADRLTAAITATETGLLSCASRGRTKAELEARARRIRECWHPSTFAEREQAARWDRCVRVRPGGDGMARLTALLPAAVAWRIDGRLSTVARTLATAAPAGIPDAGGLVDDVTPPTIMQLRADVLADLLTGLALPEVGDIPSRGRVEGASTTGELAEEMSHQAVAARGGAARAGVAGEPVPQVLLTVSADTLLGGDEPGQLGAFGPIAAADARDLAARAASFMVGVTADRPVGGTGPTDDDAGTVSVIPVLTTTGAQYRLPAALRRALAVRDGTCRFPGCRRSAARCDADHVIAWADGGSSTPGNLAHLCRKHHVLKHHSAWSVSAGPPGNATGQFPPDATTHLTWTSPTGRRYITEPDDSPPF